MRTPLSIASLLLALTACGGPATPEQSQAPGAAPVAAHLSSLYEIAFQDVGRSSMTAQARPLRSSLHRQQLQEDQGSLQLSRVAVDTFVVQGVRHIRSVFKVTNTSAQTLSSVAFVPVSTAVDPQATAGSTTTPTIGTTPFKSLLTYGGTDASGRAEALTPGAGQLLSARLGAAVADPEATPFGPIAVDAQRLTPPTGLLIRSVSAQGWQLPAPLAPGASENVTFAVNMATQSPGTDPFQFSIVVAAVHQGLSATDWEVAQSHVIPPQGKDMVLPNQTQPTGRLHLVGGRNTLALVRVPGVSAAAQVEVLQGSTVLGSVPLQPSSTLPGTENNGLPYSTVKAWVRLPGELIRPGIALRVRDGGLLSDPQPVNVGMPSSLILKVLPFYLFGAAERHMPLATAGTVPAEAAEEFREKYPIGTLSAQTHALGKVSWPTLTVGPREGRSGYVVTSTDGLQDRFDALGQVLSTIWSLRTANGEGPLNVQYYSPLIHLNAQGVLKSPGGGLGGGHAGTGDASYRGIFIHEQGHAFGLPHAGEAFTAGTYPYPGGSLKGSAWGYDDRRRQWLSPLIPSNASSFAGCATRRQLDEQGRCFKQDFMQSGDGDQDPSYRYTMLSDFNAMKVQEYFETDRIEATADGFRRWNRTTKTWDTVVPATTSRGLYGLNGGLPSQQGVPVTAIVVNLSRADAALNRVYPPLPFIGNLVPTIDPTQPAELAQVKRNVGTWPWYCRGTGCDYTLRVTYNDGAVRYVLLQGSFRSWFGGADDWHPDSLTATATASFKLWTVNVPTQTGVRTVEVLNTPKVDLDGMPAQPSVVVQSL